MTTATAPLRAQRRIKATRPGYLDQSVLDRAAENGDARLVARVRKQRGE